MVTVMVAWSSVAATSRLVAQGGGSTDSVAGISRSVTIGGYLQADGRWISGPAPRAPDGLLLRRARLIVDASTTGGWLLRLQPDFGQGRVLVQDAFVGQAGRRHVLRLGRFRPAFGTERMQSSATLLAPERGIVNSLMPSRMVGIQLAATHGTWQLAIGGFRTPIGPEAASVDTDGDVEAVAGSGHDLLVRVARTHRWAGGEVEVQSGVLAGSEQGTLEAPAVPRLLSVAQQPIATFRADGTRAGTVRAAGTRARVSTGLLVTTSQSVAALEGAWFMQRVAYGDVIGTPTVGAGTLRVARTWNGVRQRTQEIRPTSRRGAIDLGVRAGAMRVWEPGPATLLSRGSSARVRTAGVAVSWLPTPLTRLTLAYDITTRRGSNAPTEHALLARWQQGF